MEQPVASINKAVAAPAEALFDLKFHQVAIYTNDVYASVMRWVDMGFENWSFDHATLVGADRGRMDSKDAFMAFNYDILPLELEYVSYNGPRNSVDQRDGREPFLSHLSTMVEELGPVMDRLNRDFNIAPYHMFTTKGHTNPHCAGKKRFREAIYDTTPLLGFDIKLIQRVPWDWAE